MGRKEASSPREAHTNPGGEAAQQPVGQSRNRVRFEQDARHTPGPAGQHGRPGGISADAKDQVRRKLAYYLPGCSEPTESSPQGVEPAPPAPAAQLLSRDQAQGKTEAGNHILFHAPGGADKQHLGASLPLGSFFHGDARKKVPSTDPPPQQQG